VWVKFHFRTQQGIQNLTDAEAESLIASDRESHGRDLLTAIDSGDFPRWTLFIQVMNEDQRAATNTIRSTSQRFEGVAGALRGDSRFASGGDAKVIADIAKRHFGGYPAMFEHHGWPERGSNMMRKAQTRVAET
jgi:Catalase